QGSNAGHKEFVLRGGWLFRHFCDATKNPKRNPLHRDAVVPSDQSVTVFVDHNGGEKSQSPQEAEEDIGTSRKARKVEGKVRTRQRPGQEDYNDEPAGISFDRETEKLE